MYENPLICPSDESYPIIIENLKQKKIDLKENFKKDNILIGSFLDRSFKATACFLISKSCLLLDLYENNLNLIKLFIPL